MVSTRKQAHADLFPLARCPSLLILTLLRPIPVVELGSSLAFALLLLEFR
jgi:hypothetical protein